MKLVIVGSSGNMGQRYSAICRQEGIPFVGVDKNDRLPDSASHIILATPTEQHLVDILKLRLFYRNRVKLLCEKPIYKIRNISELDVLDHKKHQYFMVNQYAYYRGNIDDVHNDGLTSYNYFNSGKDGNLWDCIQLINLAKNKVKISNKSPIWECKINGFNLSRELIDQCYVKMVLDFVSNFVLYRRPWGLDVIKNAHMKVLKYERSLDRYSSKVDVD